MRNVSEKYKSENTDTLLENNKEGLNLNFKIEKIEIKEDKFYYIKDEEQNLYFYISLQDKFSSKTIKELSTTKYKGKMFIFLNNALINGDKINLDAFVR